MNIKLSFFIVAVLSVVLWRVVPHPANVTPVMAAALFCGCYFTDKKLAFLLPLLAMIVADLFIGFHGSMLFVYAGIALTVLVGMFVVSRKVNLLSVALSTVACSLAFFFLTNFGAWLGMPEFYPRSVSGLIQAYVAGIPFYKNSLVGDLLFSAILFGGYYFAKQAQTKYASA